MMIGKRRGRVDAKGDTIMSPDAWNVRGWIASPLENAARALLDLSSEEICPTFLCADDIQQGTFVEAMFYLLRQKNGLNKDYSKFAKEAQPLFGKALFLEDRELASRLLDEFCKLTGLETDEKEEE